MPHVAFATGKQWPDVTADDALVADALRARGVAVSAATWDAQEVDWSRFDGVVVRSTWDYPQQAGRYEAWVRGFSSRGPRLWNPPGAILGNINKRYLLALAEKGIDVVPTEHLMAGEGRELLAVLEWRGWDEAVVKPAVSSGAVGAWRTSRATAAAGQARFAEQLRTQDVLVQPYLEEIVSGGEWSLVFFDGAYSHAVRKEPARGDFRVQEHLGGRSLPARPTSGMVEQARAALAAVGQPLLYARVDGVDRGGRFTLMEMEINEPYLFLGLAEGAATRFADAIVRALSGAAFLGG